MTTKTIIVGIGLAAILPAAAKWNDVDVKAVPVTQVKTEAS